MGIRPQFARGFTLLEVLLALAAAMLVVGIAVLAVGSIGGERELKSHAGVLETTARGALQRSISSGRPIALALNSNGFSLGEKSHQLDQANLELRRVGEEGWRSPSAGETWTFHPSGICEPIAVRISSDVGYIEVFFDPLTASAEKTNFIVAGN